MVSRLEYLQPWDDLIPTAPKRSWRWRVLTTLLRLPTDEHTLQSNASPNLFVIGDAANVPASKAGRNSSPAM